MTRIIIIHKVTNIPIKFSSFDLKASGRKIVFTLTLHQNVITLSFLWTVWKQKIHGIFKTLKKYIKCWFFCVEQIYKELCSDDTIYEHIQ